jgi:anti-repressor protein
MNELVFKSSKGNPVTTSLKVAEEFEKEHKNVLRDIENLDCSQEFRQLNFALSSYHSVQNKKLPMYIMTEDGFYFLVMGYSGSKAGKFKEKFITAFNILKSELAKLIQLPNFSNPAEAARAWAEQYEQKQLAETKVKQLEPKASYADRVLTHDNQLVDIGQSAKLLKLPFGRNKFFERLRGDGIFFKNRNEPKQEYIDSGYFEVRKDDIPRDNHPGFVVLKVLVTSRGLFWLSKKYGGSTETNIPVISIC